MNHINLNKIMTKGKAIYLAYDQGLEHGPTDFNHQNIDPNYIIDIAKKGNYNGIIFQKGIAEKYQKEIKESKIPLIVKLNGKTSFLKLEPYSPPLCTVDQAVDMGAAAIGYTLYIGSKHEARMFQEFEIIQEQAHDYGLPVIVWLYPRGKAIKDEFDKNVLAYSARVGLELGADIIKMKYNGNPEDLKWIIKAAGKVKVVIAGGTKAKEADLLKQVKEITKAGVAGLAIGRNIWQSKKPLDITKKLKKIIFK
jgi:fructose-bisphosphate aldolase, class I